MAQIIFASLVGIILLVRAYEIANRRVKVNRREIWLMVGASMLVVAVFLDRVFKIDI